MPALRELPWFIERITFAYIENPLVKSRLNVRLTEWVRGLLMMLRPALARSLARPRSTVPALATSCCRLPLYPTGMWVMMEPRLVPPNCGFKRRVVGCELGLQTGI